MTCIVVGSGPSGANTALTLLRRGKSVQLWDVGRNEPELPHPQYDFHAVKGILEDPVDYYLGSAFEALMPPGAGELLRYPPSRSFLLEPTDPWWPFRSGTFKPFASFARGGLGLGWGANAVTYDDDDLHEWPLRIADLNEAYAEACRRVPIAGVEDRLSPFFPGVAVSQPAVRLNGHDRGLLSSFERRAAGITRRSRTSLGTARLAVINSPEDPRACQSCGRCLWGCPHGSLYNPAQMTLQECGRYPNFRYQPGRLVISLLTNAGRVEGVHFLDVKTRQEASEACDALFLAAGALQSGGIFLRTVLRDRALQDRVSEVGRTESVMDTALVKLPYIRLRSVGAQEEADQFQFNRLIIAHRKPRSGGWPIHCHGEVLSLNSLLYHALIESIPIGTRRAIQLFARFRAALGVVTYFFADKQVPGNGISAVADADSPTGDRLKIHYREAEDKARYISETLNDARRALLMLGCVPWGTIRAPAGAGIHYAGTVPMGQGALCSDSRGRANLYPNLYICDGAAFPSLPSKSITLNLVAHAIRVATLADV